MMGEVGDGFGAEGLRAASLHGYMRSRLVTDVVAGATLYAAQGNSSRTTITAATWRPQPPVVDLCREGGASQGDVARLTHADAGHSRQCRRCETSGDSPWAAIARKGPASCSQACAG